MPNRRKRLLRRIARGLGLALAGLLVLLLVAAGAAALYLPRADLKPIVERAASDALGRRVTLRGFDVRWGNPLAVELTDLAIANASWASKPEMVRIGQLSALLDVGALWRGVLRYERLRIADAEVVLERGADGAGNWKFGGAGGGIALMPKDRTQFPTLVDFIGHRGLVTYRTRGGNLLQIKLDRVAISSPGAATPARLVAEGAYNDVPARLEASTDSYAVLRNAGVPFGARFILRARHTDIAFNGRLREPLDFEGARGELSIQARTLDDILGVLGAEAKAGPPLSIGGILRRDGSAWMLAAAKGRVKQSGFSGSVALHEGEAGEPDEIDLDLDFGTLDADGIAAALGGGKRPAGLKAIPLQPGGLSGVNVTAALTAQRAAAGGRELHAAVLQGRLAGGDATLKELSFALGGGTLSMAGALAGDGANGRLSVQARLSKVNVSELARQLDATGDEIQGRLDGRAILSMTGPTVGAALARSDGAAVLTLRDGTIARSLMERLSTDLRGLFRSREGTVPVSCLLAVLTLRNGIGVLSPLRLESRAAIATGAGKIDLVNDTLDLTIRTERDSTSFFALDIPVRISGPFDRLSADPLVGSDEDWLKQTAAAADNLPPELHQMVAGSGCGQ